MRPHLARLAEEMQRATGARIDTEGVHNTLYGPLVTTAGLLSGSDHARALERYADHDIALFSRNALNEDDFFLDDLSLGELRQRFPKLSLWPSEHVTDTLLTL
jgi:hypothetical protein